MNKSLPKWISIFHIISNLPTLLSPSVGTFFVCLVYKYRKHQEWWIVKAIQATIHPTCYTWPVKVWNVGNDVFISNVSFLNNAVLTNFFCRGLAEPFAFLFFYTRFILVLQLLSGKIINKESFNRVIRELGQLPFLVFACKIFKQEVSIF